MKTILALAAVAAMSVAASASAEVLTFDDLGTGGFTPIPASYHGFNFDYWASVNGANYGASGYANGVVSGGNSACACASDFGAPSESISRAGGLTLTSGYFTAAWNDGATLVVSGFSGATQVFTTSFLVDSTGPTFKTFNWSGIDSVVFSISGGVDNPNLGGGGDYFAVDDLSISGAVPEPATWALMIGGFAMTGFAARRRRVALSA